MPLPSLSIPPKKTGGFIQTVKRWGGRVAFIAALAFLAKPGTTPEEPVAPATAQQAVEPEETEISDEEPATFQVVTGANVWDTVKLTYEANAPVEMQPDLPKRIPETTNELVDTHAQELAAEVSLPMDDPVFYTNEVKAVLTRWTGYKDVLKAADDAGATTFAQMLSAVDATYPGISDNIYAQIALTQPDAGTIHQTINEEAPKAVREALGK